MNKAIFMIAAIAAAFLLQTTHARATTDNAAKTITISAAWARATFAKAKSAAAYMTLKNDTGQADRLIAVKSPIAKKVGIHRTSIEDGIMKMGAVGSIEIPAGGMAMLKPGAHHVMFMGLKEPLKEGDHFPLTLVFTKAGEIRVDVQVLKAGATGGAHKHHH
ncbi:MAG: copper chaperone PCu(A)C [Rhodospirillales bacterium]|nr:copper chaperone PCu(A)C [Rhodospirillales bacterium]